MSDAVRRIPDGGQAAFLGLLAAGLVAPFYLDAFWVQVGIFAFAAMVAALGLNLLVGEAGQLSLAHSFFIAVGAYGYTLFASPPREDGTTGPIGWGLPPLVAVALAVAAAGVAGLLFSPIAARLRGIYLGVASLGLVFLGQHVLVNAEPVTGGFNGRDVPPLTIAGFSFDDVAGRDPPRPRRAVHPGGEALVRRAGRRRAGVALLPQRARQPGRAGDARGARRRDRRRR